MTLQLTISRTSLSLPALVATGTPPAPGVAGAWLPEDGISEPDITWRYTYAPDSSDMHGKVLLQAVKDHTALPFVLYLRGTSAASLKTLKDTWTAALEQWSYAAELLVDGQGETWSCDPTSPRWGDLDSGMVGAFMARASVVIPVYPIGA